MINRTKNGSCKILLILSKWECNIAANRNPDKDAIPPPGTSKVHSQTIL